MMIIGIPTARHLYSSNVYLVLGEWKRIEDINTLVDVGSDPDIAKAINTLDTGIGKVKVEQVILTHCHSDHTAALSAVREAYRPRVCAFSPHVEGVDHILKDGETLRVGEYMCEVIHTPGHSSDSICLYCEEESVLFAGDTPVVIHAGGGAYEEDFMEALTKLSRRRISKIYFGHGAPLLQDAQGAILESLSHVRKSMRDYARHHASH